MCTTLCVGGGEGTLQLHAGTPAVADPLSSHAAASFEAHNVILCHKVSQFVTHTGAELSVAGRAGRPLQDEGRDQLGVTIHSFPSILTTPPPPLSNMTSSTHTAPLHS